MKLLSRVRIMQFAFIIFDAHVAEKANGVLLYSPLYQLAIQAYFRLIISTFLLYLQHRVFSLEHGDLIGEFDHFILMLPDPD